MSAEERDYSDYLRDIVDASRKAIRFCEGLEYDEFVEDEKTTFAVVRALEIVGEAAKNIPESMRESCPGRGRAKWP